MNPFRRKTKAAKSTARKAPARKRSAGKKTAKKATAKPRAAKTAKAKATKAKVAKAKATKAKAAKAKATKAKSAKPKAARAKKVKAAVAPPVQAAAAAPSAAPNRETEVPSKRARSRRSRKKQVQAPAAEVLPQRTPVPGEPRSRLGTKWECFSCGAKFYDLNRPEPLCPRCGANQFERPKTVSKLKQPQQAAPMPRTSRAMAPLLDEDEDAMVVKKEELDLGVASVDEAVTKFIDEEDPEEDPIEEEDEEA
jgi:hypothetical protein